MNNADHVKRSISAEIIIPFLVPVLFIVTWEMISRLGYLSPLFFPAPSSIVQIAFNLFINGEFQRNLYLTLFRVFSGFVLGAVPGLVIGVSMGWSPKIRQVMDPIISALYPIPKIAILPLIMLVLGIGETSKIVVVSTGSFFLVLINAMAGVRNIDTVFFEVAKNYGAGKLKIFTKIILPGSLPMIFAGLRLALGMSLLLVVAVEFNTANYGLGAMIWLAGETLRTEMLYVGIIVCSLMGIIFNLVLKWIEKILMPWKEGLDMK